MNNAIRKTIDFSESMYEEVRVHGNAQGCRSFSEAVRDLIRVATQRRPLKPVLSPGRATQQRNRPRQESPQPQFLDNVVVKDTPSGGVSSSEKQRQEKDV